MLNLNDQPSHQPCKYYLSVYRIYGIKSVLNSLRRKMPEFESAFKIMPCSNFT